ncbi:hypothetical protein KBW71_27785, partial [Hydrogenophaga aromaticivorans]|uniref:histidine kinase dimerization/phospho-acceptor domain-containing protein n=1 Tax=Hydrogenophaga aromaticivorans TaxID=2610898 RepID=UPI001B760E74
MGESWRGRRWWWLGGTLLAAAGAVLIARQSIDTQRALFETDARIVHRLLSQQAVQHDAILDTLALLQPGPSAPGTTANEQRLPALYPHILAVQRRDRDHTWPDGALTAAETTSQRDRRAVIAAASDGDPDRYRLVLAAEPTSYALTLSVRGMVPWTEWPMQPDNSPVRISLALGEQRVDLQTGDTAALDAGQGWRFSFHKPLAAASQPFEVVAERQLGWSQLPWVRMAGWTAAVAAVLALVAQVQGLRTARRRAEALLRLGQVARLNTLGELAAGMAHELNQPLTAVLANTQAAQRLLADDPPELEQIRRGQGPDLLSSAAAPTSAPSPAPVAATVVEKALHGLP